MTTPTRILNQPTPNPLRSTELKLGTLHGSLGEIADASVRTALLADPTGQLDSADQEAKA